MRRWGTLRRKSTDMDCFWIGFSYREGQREQSAVQEMTDQRIAFPQRFDRFHAQFMCLSCSFRGDPLTTQGDVGTVGDAGNFLVSAPFYAGVIDLHLLFG